MDQGIQVALSELIDVISRPDWWTIGITIVNAIIMIWLGYSQYKLQKHQTELQKRQTEAQEYEMYRRLYLLIYYSNSEIKEFLNSLIVATWETHNRLDKDYLARKQKYLENIKKDLTENYWDYKLKFSYESFDADSYCRILSIMIRILQQFNESMTKGEIAIAQGCQQFAYEHNKQDEAYACIIASRFKSIDLKEMIMGGLMDFVEQKRAMRCDDEILNTIQEKCQINFYK